MTESGKLQLKSRGEREIVITREFACPRNLVFRAWTEPPLLKRWLLGPPGWQLAVCDIDLRPGGSYRFEWRHQDGMAMGMGGVYREIVAPERIVATERFDEAWYPGEAIGTIVLTEKAGRTTLTQTLLYESREARDTVLASPMEAGVAASYDRLEEVVTAQ